MNYNKNNKMIAERKKANKEDPCTVIFFNFRISLKRILNLIMRLRRLKRLLLIYGTVLLNFIPRLVTLSMTLFQSMRMKIITKLKELGVKSLRKKSPVSLASDIIMRFLIGLLVMTLREGKRLPDTEDITSEGMVYFSTRL
jgi:hypothetical protein